MAERTWRRRVFLLPAELEDELAAALWEAGTLGVETRPAGPGDDRLRAEAVGEIETEDGVLVIRRIHVRLLLQAPAEQRATAERVQSRGGAACNGPVSAPAG